MYFEDVYIEKAVFWGLNPRKPPLRFASLFFVSYYDDRFFNSFILATR